MKQLVTFALFLLMLHASAAWALEICHLRRPDPSRAQFLDGISDDDLHAPMHEADLRCSDLENDIGPVLGTSGATRYSMADQSSVECSSFSMQVALDDERGAKPFRPQLSPPFLKELPRHLYLSVLQI